MLGALRTQTLIYATGVLVMVSMACAADEVAGEEEKPTGVGAIDAFIATQEIDKSDSGWKTSLNRPPRVPFDADR